MSRRSKIIEVYGLWLIDLLCIWGTFILATYIRHANFRDMEDQTIHFQVGIMFLIFCTVYSFILDWNHDFLRRRWKREALVLTQYMTLMILTVSFVLTLLKWADVFSRLILIYFAILNFVVTFVIHCFVKRLLCMYYASDKIVTKILIIAQQDNMDNTIEELNKSLDSSYQITKTICLENLGNMDDLINLTVFDEVFINTPDVSQNELKALIKSFDEMGINCHYNLSFTKKGADFNKIESFGKYTVLSYIPVLKSQKRLLVKRLMDIIGGLVGVCITILFFPFVALAIKLESKGPVLFSQIRIGRNGRRFKIYKFRSMYRDAEARKKELESQNEVEGLMFKIENDPRITKVGRFIRKTSIDELPQFFNIVKGDMSLVGTRPPTVDEFEKYNHYYRRRISMTPGLTGLWQVSGRSNIDNFDDVVKYDLQYIDEWSLLLDIRILLKTIAVVFSGKGSK